MTFDETNYLRVNAKVCLPIAIRSLVVATNVDEILDGWTRADVRGKARGCWCCVRARCVNFRRVARAQKYCKSWRYQSSIKRSAKRSSLVMGLWHRKCSAPATPPAGRTPVMYVSRPIALSFLPADRWVLMWYLLIRHSFCLLYNRTHAKRNTTPRVLPFLLFSSKSRVQEKLLCCLQTTFSLRARNCWHYIKMLDCGEREYMKFLIR